MVPTFQKSRKLGHPSNGEAKELWGKFGGEIRGGNSGGKFGGEIRGGNWGGIRGEFGDRRNCAQFRLGLGKWPIQAQFD